MPLFGKAQEESKYDQTFEPLMKLLLAKKGKGLKIKSASEIGKKKVDYFRGRDFKKFLLESGNLLKKKCQPALTAALDGGVPADDKDVDRLGDELIQKGFVYKAQYKPLTASKQDSSSETKTKKWPDRLAQTQNQKFDADLYYVITYEGDNSMQHVFLALIIAGVLLACMFPVWPMWAKVGIWYLSVIFLSLYFGILFWRMIIYALLWIVGFDFWVFPNLNDEYCGIVDSFKPFYSWDKRDDDALMLLVRFGSLAMTAVAVQQIAETTSLSDVEDLVTSSYRDLLDWGVDKLAGALPGSEKAALPSFEEMVKEQGAADAAEAARKIMEEDADDDADVDADGDAGQTQEL